MRRDILLSNPCRPPRSSLFAPRPLTLALFFVFSTLFCVCAEEDVIELLLEVKPGRGDKPMVAVWLEDKDGTFIETVEVCSQSVKHYKELHEWNRCRREKEGKSVVAAIVGATIRWGGKRLIEIPVRRNGRNLLDGNFVLRVESAKDEGARYTDFRIALPKDFKGGTFQHCGYVAQVKVRVSERQKAEK